MSACPAQGVLEGLLAERLEPEQSEPLEQHLAGCPACQERLQRLTSDAVSERWRHCQAQGAAEAASAWGVLQRVAEVEPTLNRVSPPPVVDESAAAATTAKTPGRYPPAAGHVPPLPGGLPQIPGYEVLEELGRGGMGIVYKARQQSLDRTVALKMIRDGAQAAGKDRALFRAEAEAIARLQHPHIVQIHEVGEHQGCPFLCLEYLEGGSLAERLGGAPQPPRGAAELVETLAWAVEAAHRAGILHRDLKPANILLGADNVPKVADFGLAKRFDAEQSLRASATLAGTPSYMSPEQVAGPSARLGPGVDVYALGVILYELLTGRPPFRGEGSYETLLQVAHQDPVPPRQLQPRVPRDLETVCLRCLAKDPRKRYASALELAEDLRRFLDGRPVRARRVGPLGRAARWSRRNPYLAAALAALVVLAVGAFTWILHEKNAAATLAESEGTARKATEQALEEKKGALAAQRAEARKADKAARRAQAVSDFWNKEVIPEADPTRHGGKSVTLREALDRAAAHVGKAFARLPQDEEPVREALGRAFLRVGQTDAAVTQFTAWAALCRQLYGATHRTTLAARAELVTALHLNAEVARIPEQARGLLPLVRREFGDDHPLTLGVLANLASSRRHLGQYDEALRLQKQVLAGWRRNAGPVHERTLMAVYEVAVTHLRAFRIDEARRLCKQHLPVAAAALGADAPTTILLRAQYAQCLLALGRPDDARPEFEAVVAGLRRTRGPEHQKTLMATGNLAGCLIHCRQAEEARRLLEECVPALRSLLGAEHPQYLKTATVYGVCLNALGEYARAEAILEPILAAQRRLFGLAHANTQHTLEPLSEAVWKQGKLARAVQLRREILQGLEKALPKGHAGVARAKQVLGHCLRTERRFGEAEPLLLAAYQEGLQARNPRMSPVFLRQSVLQLAALYRDWGKPAQEAVWAARLAEYPAGR